MATSSVSITGNLTRDPELRYTATGTGVASFGVAVNRRWQNRSTQEWEEDVSYFDVSCWEPLADNVAATLRRGDRVTVVGRLDQRSWEKDGEKRYAVQIVADDVACSLRFATAKVTRVERSAPNGTTPPPAPAVAQAF